MKNKIKIGLVGENPLDTQAIENLLSSVYTEVEFVHLLYGIITGSMLDNAAMLKRLRRETEVHRPHIVLFIRDLDGLKSDADFAEKYEKRQSFYLKGKQMVNFRKEIKDEDSLFLLNICELEALILADIDVCNEYFGTKIVINKAAMEHEKPKEFLQSHCNYKETDSPAIFRKLRLNILKTQCDYFQDFMRKWDKTLAFHLK